MADEFGLIDEEYDSDVIYPVSESLVAYEELDEYDDDGSPETDDADDKVDTSSEAGFFSVLDLEVDFDSNTGVEPDDADDVMDDDVPEFDGTDDDVPEEEYVLDDNILDAPTTVNVKNGDTCIVQDIDGQPVVVGVIGGGDLMADNIAEAWKKAQEAYQKSVDSAETLIGAVNKAEQAAQDAATAKEAVAGISQYTWSDAEGTHVSTKEKVTDGAANILVNSAGIDINLDGTAHPTASFTKDGVILREYTKTDIEGETVETNKPIASFTRNGFIVGDSSNAIGALTTEGLLVGSGANKKLAATVDGVVMYDSAGSPTATFNTDGIQLAISGQPVANFGNSSIVLGGSNTTSITMAGNACLNVSKLNIGPVYNPITSKDDLKGDKGDKGEPGETPTISSNGNWIINGVETNFSAVGDDGHSPYVSGGIWYEWNASTGAFQSTGIKAQGPQGVQGPSGPSGPKGDKGDDITSQYVYYDASYGLCMTPSPNDLSGYHTRITNSGYDIYKGTTRVGRLAKYGTYGCYLSGPFSSSRTLLRVDDNQAWLAYGTSDNGATMSNGITVTKSRVEVFGGSGLYSDGYLHAQGNVRSGDGTGRGLSMGENAAKDKWGIYSYGTSGTSSGKWLIYRVSGGTVTCGSSSKQCKENIKPVSDDEARKLLDVGTYTFDYKTDQCLLNDDGNPIEEGRKGWIGVLAEDVYEVIPRAVCNTENIDIAKTIAEGGDTSSLGVDYQTFIPYLIKMTQIQQQKIDELEGRIAALENA